VAAEAPKKRSVVSWRQIQKGAIGATVVEKYSGDGKVFDGSNKFVADVHYDIQMNTQHKLTWSLTSEPHPYGFDKTVDLRLTPVDSIVGCIGRKLVLHLKDDRRMAFIVEDDSGTCRATGNFY
jgi:hypothetical protein